MQKRLQLLLLIFVAGILGSALLVYQLGYQNGVAVRFDSVVEKEIKTAASQEQSFRPTHSSSSSSSNKNNNRSNTQGESNSKPLFILHVGPAKTGTTTIQSYFGWKTKSNEKVFRKIFIEDDHYQYIGNNRGILCPADGYRCENDRKKSGGMSNGECKAVLSDNLLNLLRDTKNSNLFGSNEILQFLGSDGRGAWRMASDLGWDFRVVLSYRRWFEYLPSRYNQNFKNCGNPLVLGLPRKVKGHHDWPGIGGNIRIPTFPELFESDNQVVLKRWTNHWSKMLYENWAQDFPTSLFHFHQEGDLVTNFVCLAIPNATNYCRHLTSRQTQQESKSKSKKANQSTSYVDHDILAVYAYEQGLVHESDKRYELALAVGDHFKELESEERFDELPRVCLSASQRERLYKVSQESEAWALDVLAKQAAEGKPKQEQYKDFEAHWDEIRQSMKFCSIDAPNALKQTTWIEFFDTRRAMVESSLDLD